MFHGHGNALFFVFCFWDISTPRSFFLVSAWCAIAEIRYSIDINTYSSYSEYIDSSQIINHLSGEKGEEGEWADSRRFAIELATTTTTTTAGRTYNTCHFSSSSTLDIMSRIYNHSGGEGLLYPSQCFFFSDYSAVEIPLLLSICT